MGTLWPTPAEKHQIERTFGTRELERFYLTSIPGEPWLIFSAYVHLEGQEHYALWRATGAVHRITADGSVEDDPVSEELSQFDPHMLQ